MRKKTDTDLNQLNLFEILEHFAGKIDENYSPEQIDKVINKLRVARKNATIRKKEELLQKEIEAEREAKDAHIKEVTCMDLPIDWTNSFNSDVRTQGVHTDNISDALVLSLSSLGTVDIEYISSITGADYKTVISTLKGSIYQNPLTWNECFYKGWETAEEYLSGNLMRKWNTATEANKEYNYVK